jgi:glutaredoxin-related protein
MMPWTWGDRRNGRDEVKELTGQIGLPVLVLDEGKTVVGSGKIVDWAKAHPAYQPQVGGG